MATQTKTEIYAERAIMVGLITQSQNEQRAKEYIDELAFLADTAGATPVKTFFQRLDYPNKRTFVGEGKLQEIKDYIEERKDSEESIGMVIFDDELSPLQLRNISKELQIKILDRTTLIVGIFAKRS